MIKMTKAEEWKPIYGYTGLYEVSNLGRVRNVRTQQVLKAHSNLSEYQRENCPRNAKDYYRLQLYKNGTRRDFYVHYLVCRTFHGPRPKNHDVAHLDDDTSNNAADNVMWQDTYGNRAHHPIDCKCLWCNEAGYDDDGGMTVDDVFDTSGSDSEVPF